MSDEVAPAAPAAEAVAEVKPVAEAEPVFELEIDGKKETLTHTQARTRLQKSGALDKRFQETAETKKKLDALFAEFESDPEAALRKAGKDPEKILEGLLARKAKLALLTPEQKDALALKEERDALKAKDEAREKEKKEAADKESDARHETALHKQLVEVAEKYSLDHAPEALEGLCDVAIELMDILGHAPTLDQIAQEYMKRDVEHIEARDRKLLPVLKGERLKSYLKANVDRLVAMPAAELLDILGPEGLKAIQAATLTKVPGPVVTKKPAAIAPPPRNGAGRFTTESAFDKKWR